jgi:hypothetical protein
MNYQKATRLESQNDNTPVDSLSLEKARQLILEFGWNSTSYQILNPGIKHWFAAAGDAVVGYVS